MARPSDVSAPRSRGPSARRELVIAALGCAAGTCLIIVAAGRQWIGVTVVGAGTPISQSLTGRELAGTASAFGWAGLAGLAALAAVRGRARVVVGVLLVVFGAGTGYASMAGIRRSHVLAVVADHSNFTTFLSTDLQTGWWWTVSVAGGVLFAASGLLTIMRGGRWPGMPARYGPAGVGGPATDPGEPDQSRLWTSLDRGEDPTAGS